MPDLYAVFGNPIAHSRSPVIHGLFAAQCGEPIDYERILAPLNDFPGSVRAFVHRGGRGFNVTVPFKEEAWRLARRRTARAEKAGAVNTVTVGPDGFLSGDNTDGAGLVRDITHNLGWPLRDQNILVVGAGGAVRGVLGPLLEQGPRSVLVVNRTADRARQLAALFAGDGPVEGGGFGLLDDARAFDLVINGTSAQLGGEMPLLPGRIVDEGTRVYDMMYGRMPTLFNRWAASQGAGVCADGLGMLVEQAAEAFRVWRGRQPETAPVVAALREGC